jgi:hypothetical protein
MEDSQNLLEVIARKDELINDLIEQIKEKDSIINELDFKIARRDVIIRFLSTGKADVNGEPIVSI